MSGLRKTNLIAGYAFRWKALIAAALLLLCAACFALFLSIKPPLLDNVSFSSAYYDRNGHLLRLTLASDDEYRIYTKIQDISPDLISATLAQEDKHFFSHPGVNLLSLARAAYETFIRRSRDMGGGNMQDLGSEHV